MYAKNRLSNRFYAHWQISSVRLVPTYIYVDIGTFFDVMGGEGAAAAVGDQVRPGRSAECHQCVRVFVCVYSRVVFFLSLAARHCWYSVRAPRLSWEMTLRDPDLESAASRERPVAVHQRRPAPIPVFSCGNVYSLFHSS